MILVRHAESEWNRLFSRSRIDPGIPDPPLTATGRRQAARLADRLAEADVKRLVTSPYRRALETATIVANALGLAITVEPLIRERCVFSCDEGTSPGSWRRCGRTSISPTSRSSGGACPRRARSASTGAAPRFAPRPTSWRIAARWR